MPERLCCRVLHECPARFGWAVAAILISYAISSQLLLGPQVCVEALIGIRFSDRVKFCFQHTKRIFRIRVVAAFDATHCHFLLGIILVLMILAMDSPAR